MDGAAYAIVAGTVVMCLVMAWYSLKVFPISYDWLKLFLLLLVGILFAWLHALLAPSVTASVVDSALKVLLLGCYLVFAMGLFREETLIVAAKVGNKFMRK